jgi:hypothetical protein
MYLDEYLFSSPEYSFPILSQKDFCRILSVIIEEMSEKHIQAFNVAPENIKLSKFNDQLIITIVGLEIYQNNIINVSEFVKMKPLCELILTYYEASRKSLSPNGSNHLEMHQDSLKEFKDLIKVAYNENTYFNFNFFCETIKTINNRFSENNYFEIVDVDLHEKSEFDEETQRIVNDRKSKKIQLSQKLVRCNYCGEINLFPVFHLSLCGCNLHKNCLENSLVEYGIDQVLYESKLVDCQLFNQHFCFEDLKVIHDNQHNGFEIARQVKNFIRYQYLNQEIDTPSECSCPRLNKCKKVNKDTKKPSRNCAGCCSFCGKNHKPENCQEFILSIS